MSVFSLTFRRLRLSVRSLPRITATPAAYKHKLCCYRFQELLPATGIQLKNYCSKPGASEIDIAYYDEIKSLPDHPEKLLIDVREPEELKETGKIPTSINIPLAEVRDALSVLDVKTFKNLYGIEKPSKEKNIIFYCMIGKRSHKASEIALQLGYKNVTLARETSEADFQKIFGRSKPHYESIIIFSCRSGKRALTAYQEADALGYKNCKVYAGSWLDWAKHEGLPT